VCLSQAMTCISKTLFRGIYFVLNGNDLGCSGRVNIFCSTRGTRRDTLVLNPVISHDWGKDREMLTTSGNNLLLFFIYINVVRFNIATFVCLSQAMTCISKTLFRGIYFVLNGLSERWLSVSLNFDYFMELFELIGREWLLGDVTIPTQVIMYDQCCSRRFSQSDHFIHSKLNYNCVDT
jgi:hypothetical protein